MKREIDCIERLIEVNHSYEDIGDWLVQNKFTDKMAVEECTRDRERAHFIYSILKQKQKDEEVILLYFEWTLLPQESIKITCVTSKEEKLFTYGL